MEIPCPPIHLLFKDFVYETTVSPSPHIFSPCIWDQSTDVRPRNLLFISAEGKQGRDWDVIIEMFSGESSLFGARPPAASPSESDERWCSLHKSEVSTAQSGKECGSSINKQQKWKWVWVTSFSIGFKATMRNICFCFFSQVSPAVAECVSLS